MGKTIVIYHRADFDGIFCREIAKKHFGDTAEYIGWDYGDPFVKMPNDGNVYILDLSPECLDASDVQSTIFDRIIWIDHHKSAIEKFNPEKGVPPIKGYRIDGVSACRLTWQWFWKECHDYPLNTGIENCQLPNKEEFVHRKVTEPLAVRLAGEYDVWDKRDYRAEVFQFGLRSVDVGADFFEALLQTDAVGEKAVSELLENGKILQRYQNRNDSIAMNQSFIVEWEGLKFLALNTQAKNSLAFASKDVSETGHDALLKFSFNGKIWDCSMYHAKHNIGIDLSQIASKYGGGGHRGACGFRIDKLPFLA